MFNKNGGSRTDTLIKLVLVLFISLLSFSVGTYVGKQVSDVDHRRAQYEMSDETMAHQAEADTENSSATTGEEKDALSDEDIASLTEEFIRKEKPSGDVKMEAEEATREVASENASGYKKYNSSQTTEPAPTPTPTPKAEPSPKPSPSMKPTPNTAQSPVAPSAPAQRVASGQPPAPDMAEPRKPNSVLPSLAATAVGKYTVQVASYVEEGEAKGHAAELKNKGWNAFYIPATINGKNWYRVSVGLFSTAKSATDFQKEFQREAKVETSIVQKIVN